MKRDCNGTINKKDNKIRKNKTNEIFTKPEHGSGNTCMKIYE